MKKFTKITFIIRNISYVCEQFSYQTSTTTSLVITRTSKWSSLYRFFWIWLQKYKKLQKYQSFDHVRKSLTPINLLRFDGYFQWYSAQSKLYINIYILGEGIFIWTKLLKTDPHSKWRFARISATRLDLPTTLHRYYSSSIAQGINCSTSYSSSIAQGINCSTSYW